MLQGSATTPVVGWGQAFMTSLVGALGLFLSAIPKVIGFLLILLIGWIIASFLSKAVTAVLRKVRFDDVVQRSGLGSIVRKMGTDTDPSNIVGETVRWIVRLITLVVAFDVLGLPAVSEVLQSVVLWIPNLVVALAILIIAGLIARPVGNLARGAADEAGFADPDAVGKAARIAVVTFATIVALSQLGIATQLINALFFGFVAAVALAFGLGGRDTAGEIVRKWYDKAQERTPRDVSSTRGGGSQAR